MFKANESPSKNSTVHMFILNLFTSLKKNLLAKRFAINMITIEKDIRQSCKKYPPDTKN